MMEEEALYAVFEKADHQGLWIQYSEVTSYKVCIEFKKRAKSLISPNSLFCIFKLVD